MSRQTVLYMLLGLAAGVAGCASGPDMNLDPLEAPGASGSVSEPIRLREHAASRADSLRVTLEEALVLAMDRRPAVHAAADRVEAAKAASRQARAWKNPEAIVEVEGFGGDRPGFDEAEVTLGVVGSLDLFGRAAASGRVADTAFQEERARRLASDRETAARTRVAFHEVLATREKLTMAGRIEAATRETRDAIRREVEAGKSAGLRGIQAETAFESARLRYAAARSALELAEIRLRRLLADPGDPMPPIRVAGRLRSVAPPQDEELLEQEIVEGHPDIAAELWAAETQRMRARSAGRERWPELGVMVGHRSHRSTDFSDWVGGVSLELPLLDRKQGAVREAKKLESAARNEARETAFRLIEDLERTLESTRSASLLLESYDTEVLPRVKEAFRLVRLGYEEGKFGYLDLAAAQHALALSQAERTEALIAVDRAITDLEVLLGRTLTSSSSTRED